MLLRTWSLPNLRKRKLEMATIRCPEGSRWITQREDLTFEFRDVQIFDGICSHCDKCELEHCEYFDLSQEATRRFLTAMSRARCSIEEIKKAAEYERELRAKHGQKMPTR